MALSLMSASVGSLVGSLVGMTGIRVGGAGAVGNGVVVGKGVSGSGACSMSAMLWLVTIMLSLMPDKRHRLISKRVRGNVRTVICLGFAARFPSQSADVAVVSK